MPETELGEVESANEALDRADWIVRPDIVLNPRRKETGLIPAIADLECAIRHKPNRTCCSRKCPPFLPSLVGRVVDRAVESFFRIFRNISVPTHPKSILEFLPSPPEGRITIVTDAGRDAVDAAAFCARRDCRAGWRKACERLPSVLTRDAARVRRSRLVLTPRRWRQVRGVKSAQPGLDKNISAGRRWQKSPVTRARRKPLKPLRAGMPGDSGVLVVTRVRSTTIIAHETAGALGIRHSPRPLRARDSSTARAHRAA